MNEKSQLRYCEKKGFPFTRPLIPLSKPNIHSLKFKFWFPLILVPGGRKLNFVETLLKKKFFAKTKHEKKNTLGTVGRIV